jgi:hypothetical protein
MINYTVDEPTEDRIVFNTIDQLMAASLKTGTLLRSDNYGEVFILVYVAVEGVQLLDASSGWVEQPNSWVFPLRVMRRGSSVTWKQVA